MKSSDCQHPPCIAWQAHAHPLPLPGMSSLAQLVSSLLLTFSRVNVPANVILKTHTLSGSRRDGGATEEAKRAPCTVTADEEGGDSKISAARSVIMCEFLNQFIRNILRVLTYDSLRCLSHAVLLLRPQLTVY